MGGGSWSKNDYETYSTSRGCTYDALSDRVIGHTYTTRQMNPKMSPKDCFRECVNSNEHPNTIPVILGLDVTGSMGAACDETAAALSKIITSLFDKFKDIEFMIMGIGDIECDRAPIQIGQFESDVRIAEWLDNVYMEHGGGGNGSESYSAAWYMGLHHTKLDCFDKQGRKGIIITMGDEPLNPRLSKFNLSRVTGDNVQEDILTPNLYNEASKKFDIYHISIDDPSSSYCYNRPGITTTFGSLLKENAKVSTIQDLSKTIIGCIENSIKGSPSKVTKMTEESSESVSNEISW